MTASNQFFVPHNVLEEVKFKKMKPSSRLLYIYLCKLDNRLKDNFYRSLEDLSEDIGLSKNSIKSAKKELEKNLYIDIKRDYYTHNGFRSADRFALNGYRYLDNPTD